MKSCLFLLCCLVAFSSRLHAQSLLDAVDTGESGECIVLCGGVALRQWEEMRFPADRHDNWWRNFVEPSIMRLDQLRERYGSRARLSWLVYKPAYQRRSSAEGKDLLAEIASMAAARQANLVWYQTGDDVIRYINQGRSSGNKIITFDYFGHSNRHCFLLDYSNEILGVSKAWIHEKDLPKINGSAFSKNAFIKSWGCHSGESMSASFKRIVGRRLWGAVGKTDYSVVDDGQLPVLSTSGGQWRY